jgi:hypothetical protein
MTAIRTIVHTNARHCYKLGVCTIRRLRIFSRGGHWPPIVFSGPIFDSQRWAKGLIDLPILIRSSDFIGRYNRLMSSSDFCIGRLCRFVLSSDSLIVRSCFLVLSSDFCIVRLCRPVLSKKSLYRYFIC